MSFDGTWNCSMDTPMGKQEMQIVLASKDGQLIGKLTNSMGEAEVQEGKVEGDSATWKCVVTKPMSITLDFRAQVAGNAISGDVKLGFFGKAPFSGTRA